MLVVQMILLHSSLIQIRIVHMQLILMNRHVLFVWWIVMEMMWRIVTFHHQLSIVSRHWLAVPSDSWIIPLLLLLLITITRLLPSSGTMTITSILISQISPILSTEFHFKTIKRRNIIFLTKQTLTSQPLNHLSC